jgi:endonuclease-3
MVTPLLFKTYPNPEKLALAEQLSVEEIIRSTGFYKNKAKNIIGCAQALVSSHKGQVPQSIEELAALPGVGRKTANVVLSNCFDINEGVVVDTHVKRISGLLGLTKEETPEKIEVDLMKLFPQKDWGMLSHLMIFHGRRTCIARRPQCDLCVLLDLCPSKLKKSRSK